MSGFCKSNRHYWLDDVSQGRCCNGWKRQLFPSADEAKESGADLSGITLLSDPEFRGFVFAWVKEELPEVRTLLRSLRRGGPKETS